MLYKEKDKTMNDIIKTVNGDIYPRYIFNKLLNAVHNLNVRYVDYILYSNKENNNVIFTIVYYNGKQRNVSVNINNFKAILLPLKK